MATASTNHPLGGPASGLVNIGTPIFDSVSAWFSSGGATAWAALDDRVWQEANRRAAAAPTVEGNTEVGLPRRRPGANTVPSAGEARSGASIFGTSSGQVDAGTVRSRLGGFQDGLRNARRLRDEVSEPIAVEAAAAVEADSDLFGGQAAPTVPPARHDVPEAQPTARRPKFEAPDASSSTQLPRRSGAARPAPGPTHRLPPGRGQDRPDPQAPAPATGSAKRETQPSEVRGFGVFYRDYLPQLLALLMVEGARPAVAAEIAQDVMSAAYREWARIDKPRDWTRERALAAWADRRDGEGV